jgi:hypothetical protein
MAGIMLSGWGRIYKLLLRIEGAVLHDGDWEYEKLEEIKEKQRKKSFLCVKDGRHIAYFINFTKIRKWREKLCKN